MSEEKEKKSEDKSAPDNLKVLFGTLDKRRGFLEKAKRHLEDSSFHETTRLIALYTKVQYEAYLSAGFTPEQALTLCKRDKE